MRALRAVAQILVTAAFAGTAVGLAAYGSGYRARLDLCVAAGLAVGICWRLVAATVPPAEPMLPRPDQESLDDGRLLLTSLESRLAWGSVDPDRFRERVRPLLVELATDRLRAHRGIDPRTDPEHARRILGEPLWQLMTGALDRSPTRPEIGRMVEAIERI